MMPLITEAAARAAGLALIAWLGLGILRIRSPHQQKSVWTAVLLASLAMPWLMRAVAAPLLHTPAHLLALVPQAGLPGRLHQAQYGLGALYMLVTAMLLCGFAASWARLWLIRRRAHALDAHIPHASRIEAGWTSGMDVRVSTRIPQPAAFGSTILLPAEFPTWDARTRAAVIAHERAHVLERDCQLLWLARAYACLFWFNPMAWWLRRRLALLAEATSDEAALAALGDRLGYAEILLEFAGQARQSGSAIAMSQHNVSARIERILRETRLFQSPKPSRRLLALGAVVPVAVAAAALQFAHAQVVGADPPSPAAGAASSAGTAAQEPRIISYGDLVHLSDYYPPEAKRRGADGLVQLAVTLDTQGRATDTLIISEEPRDLGFGAAASAAAHTMIFSNPTGHPVQFIFEVKFALQPSHEGPATEDAQGSPAT
ncbi:MAG TPA: M56 family metallopeptidase [Steroidobacteraceae bacterium]|nr:M56 family metallopeptidase [Steroidobacteraceae bacterium]